MVQKFQTREQLSAHKNYGFLTLEHLTTNGPKTSRVHFLSILHVLWYVGVEVEKVGNINLLKDVYIERTTWRRLATYLGFLSRYHSKWYLPRATSECVD